MSRLISEICNSTKPEDMAACYAATSKHSSQEKAWLAGYSTLQTELEAVKGELADMKEAFEYGRKSFNKACCDIADLSDEKAALTLKLKTAVEALEFYADDENFIRHMMIQDNESAVEIIPVAEDCGLKARTALAPIKEESK
jgi:hypothetical protein